MFRRDGGQSRGASSIVYNIIGIYAVGTCDVYMLRPCRAVRGHPRIVISALSQIIYTISTGHNNAPYVSHKVWDCSTQIVSHQGGEGKRICAIKIQLFRKIHHVSTCSIYYYIFYKNNEHFRQRRSPDFLSEWGGYENLLKSEPWGLCPYIPFIFI